MEDKFIKGIQDETNIAITENGAVAYRTTQSDLVDLFGVIGALRNRPSTDIIMKFTKALAEDKLLAMKMLFYVRNIRGGLGERRTFRIIAKYLAAYHTDIMRKNLKLIPEFGRWDDLYEFVGTPLEDEAFAIIHAQLLEDMGNCIAKKPVSLLAKWLKSTSKVSHESMKLGKLTAKKLGMTYKTYRKTLSTLRNYLAVVERDMSLGLWNDINYEHIPALAMKKYKAAFKEHTPEYFENYIQQVKEGKATIKAATLYPYNIMEDCGLTNEWRSDCMILPKWTDVAEEQWKALPNYVEGKNRIMIVADTSGSMSGRPRATSIGLATYFAERNEGAFKNKFIVFAGEPAFVELKGSNLMEKIKCIPEINASNTNIEKVFDLILDTAVNNNLTQEELPAAIAIISDMEFDHATTVSGYRWAPQVQTDTRNKTMDTIAAKFQAHGYVIPKLIFWNVDSRQDVYHATCEYKNVSMLSGQSVATFKHMLAAIDENPYDTMLKTLSDPIYDVVKV